MTPEQLCGAIAEPGSVAHLSLRWGEAVAARPAGPLPFIDPAAVAAAHRACGLDDDSLAVLQDVAGQIAQDEPLQALAWYMHWRLWLDPVPGNMGTPPELQTRLGRLAGAFHLLLATGFPAALTAVHRRRGYPPEATAETAQQVRCMAGNYRRGQSASGLYARQLPWLRTYLDDAYVRLGRLEFQLARLSAPIVVLRNRRDGGVLTLAADGLRLSDDGLCLPGDAPATVGWTARLQLGGEIIIGHRIDPTGYACRASQELAANDWEPLMRSGDDILSIHIPVGGGMDLESCADSFRRAVEFFPRHHPEHPPRAMWCSTWFLDPRLEEILPADANPLRLQRCLHLHPVKPWGDGGLWFVFLGETVDPARLPRDTSLRRALAGFLDGGRRWHGGGGFLPFDQAAALHELRPVRRSGS